MSPENYKMKSNILFPSLPLLSEITPMTCTKYLFIVQCKNTYFTCNTISGHADTFLHQPEAKCKYCCWLGTSDKKKKKKKKKREREMIQCHMLIFLSWLVKYLQSRLNNSLSICEQYYDAALGKFYNILLQMFILH